MSADLTISTTDIPGLLIIELPLHADNRGWFKENWQREKMVALGMPDFTPVQQNVSFNAERGVTRGVHAEPWDKLISLAHGRIFGAWVDLRAGETFGRTVTVELGPERAVFVPRGVGNSYQTLEPDTAYSYLVNEHWSAAARASYTFVNLADPALAIAWPIPLEESIRSEADLAHPRLSEVTPMPPRRTVILGANGQLGRALRQAFPDAEAVGRDVCDITQPDDSFDWTGVGAIINAAAYTAVDAAEHDRQRAWGVNVTGVRQLVAIARRQRATLVHVSSDYVFDGTNHEHTEDEPLSPLGFYGVTKAAADEVVATWDRHYIVRTSWVVGEGKNFLATMASLAERGIEPAVVDDQHGRLTHTSTLAEAIAHLLRTDAAYGSYNVTNSGPVQTWADIAADLFERFGRPRSTVTPVSTRVYAEGKDLAPRPEWSTLNLDKITAAGYPPPPSPSLPREPQ